MTARYREKTEEELRWNKIRRRLTRELDTQIADFREEVLNKLLSESFAKYAATLESGDRRELEPHYEEWVGKALKDAGVSVHISEVA